MKTRSPPSKVTGLIEQLEQFTKPPKLCSTLQRRTLHYALVSDYNSRHRVSSLDGQRSSNAAGGTVSKVSSTFRDRSVTCFENGVSVESSTSAGSSLSRTLVTFDAVSRLQRQANRRSKRCQTLVISVCGCINPLRAKYLLLQRYK